MRISFAAHNEDNDHLIHTDLTIIVDKNGHVKIEFIRLECLFVESIEP